ncbi:MAG: hypothetical protein WCG29_05280, partial [Desulfomonile sp.]
IQTVIDTEQMAGLPVDLALGDVVITKGTIAPVVQGPTVDVNLNSALSVSNKEVAQVTTVTVLANPSSSNGWHSITVDPDPIFLASVGFPPGTLVVSPLQITIKGATAGQATAVLGTLQGTLNPSFHGNAQILIYAQDPDGDWAADTLSVTVNPLPPVDPVIAVPLVDQTVTANVTSPITGISISDADIGTTGKLTVTLSALHGTLTVQVPATTPGSTPVTYTNAIVTFTDTLTNVNTALAGLKYTPTAGYTGYHDERISITAVDQSTPTQGHDTKTVVINVNAITYDNPIVHVPGTQTVNWNVPTPISDIYVSESGYTGQFTVTLSVVHGTVTVQVPATTPGTTPTVYTNANVTFTDTLTNVNTALAGLKYTPTTGYTGAETLTITGVDQNSTPLSDKETVHISVINYAPAPVPLPPITITAPTVLSVNEDTAVTIRPAMTVDYSDPGRELKVTLHVDHGSLTLGWKGWLDSYTGDVTPDAVFTGMVSDVNNALYNLKYAPVHNWFGTDTLTVTVDDQSIPAAPVTKTVRLNVNSINDPPLITAPGTLDADQNVTKLISGVSVTDPELLDSPLLMMNMTLGVLHGTVAVTGAGPSPNIVFTDTLANVNSNLGTLTYTPVPTYQGPDWLTISANDQGNSGSGGPMSDTKTVLIKVGKW